MGVKSNNSKIEVSPAVRLRWADLRKHGEFGELHKRVGGAETLLRKALNEGQATAVLQQKITDALVEMAAERKAAEKELEKQQLAALKNA